MNLINYPSVSRRIQNNRSLLFTGDGVGGDELTFSVPQIQFSGAAVGSAWYKIDNPDPPGGEAGFVSLQSPPNTLAFGLEYDVGDNAIFFADLNGSRFESPALFDADLYNGWSHFAFYIDWQNPGDSVFYYNNVLTAWNSTPTANSTLFVPQSSSVSLANVEPGVEWAQVWLADPGEYVTAANFASTALPKFSNRSVPCGLGKRGGVLSTRPWVYLSFQEKESFAGTSDGLINDANGAVLDFGTFVDFTINTNAGVGLP